MSKLADSIGNAFDEITAPAVTPDATEAPTTAAPTSHEGDLPTVEDKVTPETPSTPTDAANVEHQQAKTVDPLVDASDLKAIEDRFVNDHPELQSVLAAARREMERGLNKKFESLAALRKETAEAVVQDDRLKNIPREELLGMASMYQQMNGSPEQRAQVADFLFNLQEQLRGTQQNTQYTPQSNQANPDMEEVRSFIYQQKLEQLQTQLQNVYTSLQSEFGGNPIPQNQRDHVEEYCRTKNLGVDDIPFAWRALYGADYARAEGVKKGQVMKQEKQAMGVGNTTAPAPVGGGGDSKPKNMADRLSKFLDDAGVKG